MMICWLDAIKQWKLNSDQKSSFKHDLEKLGVDWFGLDHLYQTVLRCEGIYANGVVSTTGRLSPEASRAAMFARCAFDWYSVSVYNYVSLTGWIAHEAGLTTEQFSKYRDDVLPVIKIHRNKIGAHYSRHTPHKDGVADQMASTMYNDVAFDGRHFVVNSWIVAVIGAKSSKSTLERWSLAETHERLRERYGVALLPQ